MLKIRLIPFPFWLALFGSSGSITEIATSWIVLLGFGTSVTWHQTLPFYGPSQCHFLLGFAERCAKSSALPGLPHTTCALGRCRLWWELQSSLRFWMEHGVSYRNMGDSSHLGCSRGNKESYLSSDSSQSPPREVEASPGVAHLSEWGHALMPRWDRWDLVPFVWPGHAQSSPAQY